MLEAVHGLVYTGTLALVASIILGSSHLMSQAHGYSETLLS